MSHACSLNIFMRSNGHLVNCMLRKNGMCNVAGQNIWAFVEIMRRVLVDAIDYSFISTEI